MPAPQALVLSEGILPYQWISQTVLKVTLPLALCSATARRMAAAILLFNACENEPVKAGQAL